MKLDLIERYPQESTREYIYRLLHTNIINLNLPPGSDISEQDIAAILDVSRTPIREAFIKLSQEKLLDILPQRGTYVSLIEPEQVDESKFLREHIEREVVQLACTAFPSEAIIKLETFITLQEMCIDNKNYIHFFELDENMHGTIFAVCKKGRIWSMIQQMSTHYNRVRMLNLASGYDWPRIIDQHKELVRAIKEGDKALGRSIVDIHLNKVVVDLDKLQKEFSHYFKQPKQYSGAVFSSINNVNGKSLAMFRQELPGDLREENRK